MTQPFDAAIEERLIAILRHHLAGLRAKVTEDFSDERVKQELANLRGDPIYPSFGFDTPEYVVVRLMGRISISVGRRLGDIYERLPRFAAAARFGLTEAQVAPKFAGLELDVCLRYAELSEADQAHVKAVAESALGTTPRSGLGIEIRYNFNPNDSARLRKDNDVARLSPVYLVFSSISPRAEAIASLTRHGWRFLTGDDALSFVHELVGVDLRELMARESVRRVLGQETEDIMKSIFSSAALTDLVTAHVVEAIEGP